MATIIFFNKDACIQFSEGSKLIVRENAAATLGSKGHGILALRTGSEIFLEKNTTLEIDLRLEMHELPGEVEKQNIYTHLSPGAKLSFTKHALVGNQFSIDQAMKMYVYLNGGSIDLSQLSPEERKLIVVIDTKEENWPSGPSLENVSQSRVGFFRNCICRKRKRIFYHRHLQSPWQSYPSARKG